MKVIYVDSEIHARKKAEKAIEEAKRIKEKEDAHFEKLENEAKEYQNNFKKILHL